VVDGIRTVAVPVFDHETVAATLGFVGTTAGIPADPNSGLAAALREAAAQLSRELGYAGEIEDKERAPNAAATDANRSRTKSEGAAASAFGMGRALK
jgi:hypothetical protein